MAVKEIRLRSELFSFMDVENPEEEIEQHLTIGSDGSVEFTALQYVDRVANVIPVRTLKTKLSPEDTEGIFSLVEELPDGQTHEKSECGSWDVQLFDENGTRRTRKGLMMDDELNRRVSESMRLLIPIDHLFLIDARFDVPDGDVVACD